jgi:hypothetical protein
VALVASRAARVDNGRLVTEPPAPVARWLHLEQHVNEPIYNRAFFNHMRGRHNGVHTPYRPEAGAWWPQEHVLVDAPRARSYGPVRRVLGEALGLRFGPCQLPLFVHPQSRELFAPAIDAYGLARSGAAVSATSSSRAVLLQPPRRPPCVLKLGIATFIGGRWRGFEEHQLARGILLSRLVRAMPASVVSALRFEWFDEVCGAAIDVTGAPRDTSGWLLRRLPACLVRGKSTLVPLFSLVSREDGEPSMLTRMIRGARADPATFAIERLVTPLVRVYAHLALAEGLFGEMHPQNVLYEVGADGALTGKIVIRDFTDMTLNIPLRVAQGRPLRRPPEEFLPENRPLELAWITTERFIEEWRDRTRIANLCVNGHGLQGSVWVIHRGLRAAFPDVRFTKLEGAYLSMWRTAVNHHLGVDPIPFRGPGGIPVNEAMQAFFSRVSWRELGARPSRLPRGARVRWIGDGPKRAAARGLALETAWGEVFIVDGSPAFFRPAF